MQKPSGPTQALADSEIGSLSPRQAAARRLGHRWSEWHRREDEYARESPWHWARRRPVSSTVGGVVIAGIAAVISGEIPRPAELAAIALALGYAGFTVARPVLNRYRRDRAGRVVYERPARRVRNGTT